MKLYDEFLRIASTLNNKLEIEPVLYGSLGLEQVTGISFEPEDIDILVPLLYLKERWKLLVAVMESMGYQLVDLREHEFKKQEMTVGFAYIEDLRPFAGIDDHQFRQVQAKGARYLLLSKQAYLDVYQRSLTDSYRQHKKNDKDQQKIDILQQLLEK